MDVSDVFWTLLKEYGITDGSRCPYCVPRLPDVQDLGSTQAAIDFNRSLKNMPTKSSIGKSSSSFDITGRTVMKPITHTPDCRKCKGTGHHKHACYVYDADVEAAALSEKYAGHLGVKSKYLSHDITKAISHNNKHRIHTSDPTSFSPQCDTLKALLQRKGQPTVIPPEFRLVGDTLRPKPQHVLKVNVPGLSHQEVTAQFTELFLPTRNIKRIGNGLKDFSKLRELSLTGNNIKTLQNLPDSLQILNAYGNKIDQLDLLPAHRKQRVAALALASKYASNNNEIQNPYGDLNTVSSRGPAAESLHDYANPNSKLLHLGLGYNALSNVVDVVAYAHSLLSLDLSFNELCSIAEVLVPLQACSSLQHLHLLGNPLCMRQSYPSAIAKNLSGLTTLDGMHMEHVDSGYAKLLEHLFKQQTPAHVSASPSPRSPGRKSASSKSGKSKRDGSAKNSARDNNNNNNKPKKKLSKKELLAEAELQKHKETQRLRAADKFQKDCELALTREWLCNPSNVDHAVRLSVKIDMLSGLVCPSIEMEEKFERMERQREEALQARQGHSSQSKHRSDAQKKLLQQKKQKQKHNLKGKKGKKGEELENYKDFTSEWITEEQEDLVHTKKQHMVKCEVTYYVQYRLAGTEIFRTPEFEWEEVVVLPYEHTLSFEPCIPWRNFLRLLGIDFLVIQKITTHTSMETTITTQVLVKPDIQDEGKESPRPVSHHGSQSNSRASSSHGNARNNNNNNSNTRTKKKSNKKNKGEEYKEEVDVKTESSTTTTLRRLGVAHVDTSALFKPKRPTQLSILTVDKEFALAPAPDEADWAPNHEYRLPEGVKYSQDDDVGDNDVVVGDVKQPQPQQQQQQQQSSSSSSSSSSDATTTTTTTTTTTSSQQQQQTSDASSEESEIRFRVKVNVNADPLVSDERVQQLIASLHQQVAEEQARREEDRLKQEEEEAKQL